jgi:hypothetical protein
VIDWRAFVAVDQAQTRFDERLREAGPDGRMRLNDRMYRDAFQLVWLQADRAGPMTELELARFLLRRLYPDLEGERLETIMARLEAEWLAGTWTGLNRPAAEAPFAAAAAAAPASEPTR